MNSVIIILPSKKKKLNSHCEIDWGQLCLFIFKMDNVKIILSFKARYFKILIMGN